MITIEHEFDNTTITLLDDSGEFEDVAIVLYEDTVFIQQYYEDTNKSAVIALTPKMWKELMVAMDLPEGAYQVKE